ncbi:hypothetical protein JJL05_14345 [Staphylococcus aureus]|uniref:hypothetical protein n=1 Tax=Staphylococcus aureus TaxID=1280 RepID=UPI000A83B42D|nr:hypothetical protein [Staphylococcus aureus]MBE9362363.1 hypothetical protein [Staphylococcus aureus]MBK4072915.1 hypothetical protein [Staphylococcus aureus]
MSCCGGSSKKDKKKDDMTQPSPLNQLKIRLVKGEIDMEEYLQTKEVIEQP